MNYQIAAVTDVGIKKTVNQDSLLIKVAESIKGPVALAVLCDGMGGLSLGELASKTTIRAFSSWFQYQLPELLENSFSIERVKEKWDELIHKVASSIRIYGIDNGLELGTTVTVLLMIKNRYLIMSVGDTRAYCVGKRVNQITIDHTLVQREVQLGYLTEKEAKVDKRRHILLQCIGASDQIIPDYFEGTCLFNEFMLLCSDGFYHEIRDKELLEQLKPTQPSTEEELHQGLRTLINLAKARKEQDNLSAIIIQPFVEKNTSNIGK